MKKYIFILLLALSNMLIAQTDYDKIIDTEILANTEFRGLDTINTSNLEFSPAFYDGGIIFVSSMSKGKKKIDRNINEAFFTLRYSEKDSLGVFRKDELFSFELKIKNHFGPCAFSKDQNLMFLSRNKKREVRRYDSDEDLNPFGIYIYKYKEGFWVLESDFPLNSNSYNVFHPTWDEANQRLIFASDMPGGYGKTDLYSIKLVNGKWIELMNLGAEINTDQKEAFPFIYNSKYLFYASDVAGGKGGFDQYLSIEEENKFIDKINLGDKFNTESDDFGLILNFDATEGYFSSNRSGGKGKDDIYTFASNKSVFRVFNSFFTIKVTDKESKKGISNAKVTFSKYRIIAKESPKIAKIKGIEKEIIYTIDPSSIVESQPLFTDVEGKNQVKLAPGTYIVKVVKDGYLLYSSIMDTDSNNRFLDIKLSPSVKDKFIFSFLDSETRSSISGLEIKLEDGDLLDKIIKKGDKYTINLIRGDRVKLIASSELYHKKELIIEYGRSPSNFDIVMDKINKYVEYLPTSTGEVMVLKDILYKYNSDKLTLKAKKEIRKLVKHLKTHPDLVIELSSYTDSRGKKDYNQKLSERRSKSVKKYLKTKGISGNRIKTKGYGESKLKNHCSDGVDCSDAEHAINRRTEVKVL